MKSKLIVNGDVKISYYVMGEGPAICLIPSTGRGVNDFFELAEKLVELGFQVILPQPRGIGESKGTLSEIDFHDLASDTVMAIRAEVDNVIIAGHAYGCWIARTVAADYPELVRGLVLVAAGSGEFPVELTSAIDILTSTNAKRQERLDALRLAFFAVDSDPEKWLAGWCLHVKNAQRAARAKTELTTWKHSGNAPILDIVALQDPFRPPSTYNDYIDQFGNRVSQKFIDKASHALPDEKPEQVAQHLLAWAKTLR